MSDEDPLKALLELTRTRTADANEIYLALKKSGNLPKYRRLVFRCEKRCALLDIIDSPVGRIIGFPRYKTSPTVTLATSNEAGRAKNTEDGFGKWKAHAAYAENVSNPPLSCDHLHNRPLADEEITAALAAGLTEVIVYR